MNDYFVKDVQTDKGGVFEGAGVVDALERFIRQAQRQHGYTPDATDLIAWPIPAKGRITDVIDPEIDL